MLEVLIAAGLLSALLISSLSLLSRGQRGMASLIEHHEAENDFDIFLKMVGLQFGRRYLPSVGEPAAVALVTGLTGQPNGCPGLEVRTRNTSNVRSLHRFYTVCADGGSFTNGSGGFLQSWSAVSCGASQHLFIVAESWTTDPTPGTGPSDFRRTFPTGSDSISAAAVCFSAGTDRFIADGNIWVLMQAHGGEKGEVSEIRKRIAYRLDDHNPLLEVNQ